MNVTHAALDVLAGAFIALAVLAACFLIGFVVTCGVWRADSFMATREEKREQKREVRNALSTVDEGYARLCDDPEQE